MGGNGSSHLSEGDKVGGVTFVKGIRLSDKVINRMKMSSISSCPHLSPETSQASPAPEAPAAPAPPSPPLLPPSTPHPPPLPSQETLQPPEVVKPFVPPPPVKFHSLPSTPVKPEIEGTPASPPESITPLLDSTPPPVVVQTQTVPQPPTHEPLIPPETQTASPQVVEQISDVAGISSPNDASPPIGFLPPPCELTPVTEIQLPATTPPEPMPTPVEAFLPSFDLEPSKVEPSLPVASTPSESAVLLSSAEVAVPSAAVEEGATLLDPASIPSSHLPTSEPSTKETLPCHKEPLAIITPVLLEEPPSAPFHEEFTATAPPSPDEDGGQAAFSAAFLPASADSPEVNKEELRQKVRAEMLMNLEAEMSEKRKELEQQLEELKKQTEAEAKATARAEMEEEVRKTIKAEEEAYMKKLSESITEERNKAEDVKLMVEFYWLERKARQLDEKEEEMKIKNELRKQHVAKLEAKCAQFYKVSTESFQKGKEETHNRFARFNIQPICGDLQDQILKCYKGNAGKTLICSGIASAYMQCVDKAKKEKVITGG